MKNKISRRSFLSTTATAAAAFTVIPSHAMGRVFGYQAPSDKLNIAIIGPGGMGGANMENVQDTENIVALCDVDWPKVENRFKKHPCKHPNAKRYSDYRKMYDEMKNIIDAVIVGCPDHNHAIIAADAITLGKHVFVQKPMTHSVYESRLLTKLASKYKIATQMGNQGSSGASVRQICDWIWNGEIGEVKRVDIWTDRPIWPQGLNPPKQPQQVPDYLNWDLFIGPAKMIPYHEVYHPWTWRGWWNFGTGALGDMACHLMHPTFKSLQLGYPTKVQGRSSLLLLDSAPISQMVRYTFPARTVPSITKVKFPEVEVYWYDGGLKPMLPKGWPDGKIMSSGGTIFHGDKDTLIFDRNPWLLSGRVPNPPKTQREITVSHEMDWVRACKENPENRTPTASNFNEAGPFNEMVVMGVLAVRLQGLSKELEWDGLNMKFTNIGNDETIRMVLEDRFSIVDGDAVINPIRTDPINAKAFAEELIKHTYREGWKLPDMPA